MGNVWESAHLHEGVLRSGFRRRATVAHRVVEGVSEVDAVIDCEAACHHEASVRDGVEAQAEEVAEGREGEHVVSGQK